MTWLTILIQVGLWLALVGIVAREILLALDGETQRTRELWLLVQARSIWREK